MLPVFHIIASPELSSYLCQLFMCSILSGIFFVILAYGEQWFGTDSFIIAHNYVAKEGSGVVFFVISYLVIRILPELHGMIDGLWIILSQELRLIIPGQREIKSNASKELGTLSFY